MRQLLKTRRKKKAFSGLWERKAGGIGEDGWGRGRWRRRSFSCVSGWRRSPCSEHLSFVNCLDLDNSWREGEEAWNQGHGMKPASKPPPIVVQSFPPSPVGCCFEAWGGMLGMLKVSGHHHGPRACGTWGWSKAVGGSKVIPIPSRSQRWQLGQSSLPSWILPLACPFCS